jgi:hypothetical protein
MNPCDEPEDGVRDAIFEAEKLIDMLRGFLIYIFRNANTTKGEKKRRLEDIEKQMHELHKVMPTFEYSEWCSLLDDIETIVNQGK